MKLLYINLVLLSVFFFSSCKKELSIKYSKPKEESSKKEANNFNKNIITSQTVPIKRDFIKKPKNILAGLSFTDIYDKKIDVAKMRGKVVVFDFWASWCAPCIRQIPDLKGIYNKFDRKDVEFIGVSLDQSKKDAAKAINFFKLPWLQYYKPVMYHDSLPQLLNIFSIPYMIVLDQKGHIASQGHLSPNELYRFINKLLAKEKKQKTKL